MNAPHKEALLKALEQIIEIADAGLSAAKKPLRSEQLVAVLTRGHTQIRSLARVARGDRRWGRRPSLTPLPPKDDV